MKKDLLMIHENYQIKIIEFLESRMDLVVVYLFGSILGAGFNDESDIDIAVITEKEMYTVALYELSSQLSVITKRDIHLVDFLKVSDVLKIEILKNKKIIFNNNDDKRLYYEMNALTAYEKLNEEREIVIKAKYGEAAWTLL